ncbi:tyrosine-type recombinase/integrase (plasmid) [Lysinibacillus capsici]|uniref:tyrosine-type recombinase/integrase n=1 Tax=Lysinibacillus capsici TaxID=2115968 RepID=UPI0021DA710A|nr:tyrosine-type recombinase/integrase [Lysinibacillus capsici]UYB50368.1 tyrosine-type recombinase/integrase [Lysinibacillus capsici]
MNFVQPIRDMDKVIDVQEFLASKNKRDELLFCFGIYTGLRISDILRVKKSDVYKKDFFLITEIKTQNSRKKSRKVTSKRRIPIVPELKKMISVYCKELRDEEYLFKSRQGRNQPITRVRAYDILREAAHACGLSEIGTHTLRKTFGYHMYQEDKDVALLQDIFGHSDPYITLKYIGVNQDAIDKAYSKLRFKR